MVVNTSVDSLVTAVRQSGLLPPDQLLLLDSESAGLPGEPKELARELVKRSWLTPYQVREIWYGRGAALSVGPYRLLELLGEGGMGQVFKALHVPLNRFVALKVIRPNLVANSTAVRRFRREAQSAAQLSHENIVLIFDHGSEENRHYLSMEYVDGTDLSSLVKEHGPLPIRTACDYARQTALGLKHAHENGLIHRDIKPGNLFVTPDNPARKAPAEPAFRLEKPDWSALTQRGRVKILDMGLARLREQDDDKLTSLTQEGMVIGTPDYMAPEQAKNSHNVDHRADLYSLGCTLYYLLAGRLPFPEGTMVEKLLKHQFDKPTSIASLRPDVPLALQALIHALMAKAPDDRIQSAAQVAAALEPFVGPKLASALPVPTNLPVARAPVPAAVPTPMPSGPATSPFDFDLEDVITRPPTGPGKRTSRMLPRPVLPRASRRRQWPRMVGFAALVFVAACAVGLLTQQAKPEAKDPPAALKDAPAPKAKPAEQSRAGAEAFDRFIPADATFVVHVNVKQAMQAPVYQKHLAKRVADWVRQAGPGWDFLPEADRCLIAGNGDDPGRVAVSFTGLPAERARQWLKTIGRRTEGRPGDEVYALRNSPAQAVALTRMGTLVFAGEDLLRQLLGRSEAGRAALQDEALAAALPAAPPTDTVWFALGGSTPWDKGTLSRAGLACVWGQLQLDRGMRVELNIAGESAARVEAFLSFATIGLTVKALNDRPARALMEVISRGDRSRQDARGLAVIRVQNTLPAWRVDEWAGDLLARLD